jgi:hypothetical protein
MLNQPCIFGIYPSGHYVLFFFIYYWIWFAKFFTKNFALYSRGIVVCGHPPTLLFGLCLVMELEKCWLHRNSWEIFLHLSLWEWYHLSLNVSLNLPMKAYTSWECFCVLSDKFNFFNRHMVTYLTYFFLGQL